MKKSFILLFLLLSCLSQIKAQNFSSEDLDELKMREDSMKSYAFEIINGADAAYRFRSDSNFTRMFVRALKIKNSFYYPFDSLKTISILYAPDSSFRIFTWQVVLNENYCRQRGAIQMNTPDGSLKLYGLVDNSEFIKQQVDTVTNNLAWVGAIYYRIIMTNYRGQKYYTLIGYDENNIRSTRKWIDVLHFANDGRPVFGGPFFSFAEDSIPGPTYSRFLLEYKKDGRARVQFEDDMGIIIFDHLISENNQPEKKWTYIPDGDYEGFQWKNGQWVHIDKVWNFKLKDGEFPVPNPLDFNKKGEFGNVFDEIKQAAENPPKKKDNN